MRVRLLGTDVLVSTSYDEIRGGMHGYIIEAYSPSFVRVGFQMGKNGGSRYESILIEPDSIEPLDEDAAVWLAGFRLGVGSEA